MVIKSNQKGKAGERELAAVIRAAGYEARRGRQYCGVNGDADIVHSIPGLYIECKRVERLNLAAAYEQARDDAGAAIPVVVHRASRQPWMITLSLNDFLDLMGVDDAL